MLFLFDTSAVVVNDFFFFFTNLEIGRAKDSVSITNHLNSTKSFKLIAEHFHFPSTHRHVDCPSSIIVPSDSCVGKAYVQFLPAPWLQHSVRRNECNHLIGQIRIRKLLSQSFNWDFMTTASINFSYFTNQFEKYGIIFFFLNLFNHTCTTIFC